MKGSFSKKMILVTLVVFFFAPLVVIPMVSAYGTDFTTAEIIPKGTHDDTLLAADNDAYFKFYCFKNTKINVTLCYNDSYYLWLLIFDPDKYEVERDSSPDGCKPLNHTCQKNGYYFLRVYRYFSPGDIDFQIQIEYTGFIPGFEFPIILVGVLFLLGLALIRRKVQKAGPIFI